MLNRVRNMTMVALGLMIALALPSTASAELRKVDQSVFGMDCAPCAFGVERSLKNLDGVTEVTVSLNDAKAVVELEEGNRITLKQIRTAIRHGGFDPREARVEARGTLTTEKKQDQLVLALEPDEQFRLRPAAKTDDDKRNDAREAAWQRLQALDPGQRIRVHGTVPKFDEDHEKTDALPALHVERVEQLPEQKQQED